ncbi:Protein EPIDERMAL PATTERNING FACTOR 1 [Linum grandiflorum]
MKGFLFCFLVLSILVVLPRHLVLGRHIVNANPSHHGHHHSVREGNKVEETIMSYYRRPVRGRPNNGGPDTVQIAGSSLPDCSHACGSCSPCRLVMVSFVCASLEEAETCPMAYKCMCRNKSYPVP